MGGSCLEAGMFLSSICGFIGFLGVLDPGGFEVGVGPTRLRHASVTYGKHFDTFRNGPGVCESRETAWRNILPLAYISPFWSSLWRRAVHCGGGLWSSCFQLIDGGNCSLFSSCSSFSGQHVCICLPHHTIRLLFADIVRFQSQ